MAEMRLKISDGTTTVDLFGGTASIAREGGVSMPPPEVKAEYVSSPFSEGARMASSKYNNRVITISLKIVGTSLTVLRTNVRQLQRILNDAKERYLSGFGSLYYLEVQWGDTAGQSVFFDILRGDLAMPDDYMSVLLKDRYTILDATLTLVCKPFGRFANQAIAQDTLENEDSGANKNYMDIATVEGHGDVPARMYAKIALSGATGSKKMWIAKRSGVRQADSLFTQGEDEASSTNIIGGAHTVTFSDQTDAALSGGKYRRTLFAPASIGFFLTQGAIISRHNYTITTIPRGLFRVLAYCRLTSDPAGLYYGGEWAMGWAYGNREYAPSEAKGEWLAYTDNSWGILDLGLLKLPPIAESEIAANTSLDLRIFQRFNHNLYFNDFVDPDSGWSDEAEAYDKDTATYAKTANIDAGDWSKYLQLKLPTTAPLFGGVCFWVEHDFSDSDVDYFDGAWKDLGSGAVTAGSWKRMVLASPVSGVTQVRFRFKRSILGFHKLNEAQLALPDSYLFDLDYIFLLPIDEGAVIVNNIASTDILALDSISDPSKVLKIDATDKIVDTPDYVGAPFNLGRQSTRLYVLRDDVKGVQFLTDLIYQSQFLVI